MATCTVTIPNEEGLHARPAAKFVKVANGFSSNILVQKDDEEINGKSIMGLMILAAAKGEVITITAEGKDEAAALKRLSQLVSSGFSTD